MKTKLWAIYQIRHRDFETENGQVVIYWEKKDAEKKIKELGKYHADGGVLLRVMPIYLKRFDNEQIFEAIYSNQEN